MSCNCNKPTNIPCGCEPCEDTNPGCSCPIKDLSTDCVLYTGDRLSCSGIETDTVLTDLIIQLDEFICDKFNEAINYLTLTNVGSGAQVFRGISGTGEKELRTIVSENTTLLDIVENSDTIGVRAGTPNLSLNSATDVLSLIMTTISGATILSNIDLSEYNYDTFVQSASFNTSNQILTIVRNNGEPNITVDLSFLNNHLETAVYLAGTNTIRYTITDGSNIDLDVSTLVNEILNQAADNQIQSDYLESNTASKAYILNRNPSKTVTGNYTVVTTDNNYIIEVDNGASDVTINVGGSLGTNNFFVGFIQKGSGNVTITGATSIPLDLTNVIYGQGHVCALEIINGTKYLIGQLQFS